MQKVEALREALIEAQQERDVIAVERAEAEDAFDKREELADTEIQGLTLAIARLDEPMQNGSKRLTDWTRLQRTAAVMKMMAVTGREVGPGELALVLQQVGRNEDSAAVSQTLQYLKRKNPPRVENRGRNRWVVVEPRDHQDGDGGVP